MIPIEEHLRESLSYIREHTSASPRIGIILGSGLGDFADSFAAMTAIPTAKIPHYPRSSVEGHKGNLIFARLHGKDILAFQGRVHFYESNSIETVLYPIRVAHAIGVSTVLVTNAAGGVNRSFSPGDLMIVTDQINCTNVSIPSNSDKPGKSNILYSSRLIRKALDVAEANGIFVRLGVYVGLKGPSYETGSEVEMIHRIGGDAVGMSTVLEVSLATQLGMEVLGISCITNLGTGIGTNKLSHAEVTEVGNRVKATFAALVSSIVDQI